LKRSNLQFIFSILRSISGPSFQPGKKYRTRVSHERERTSLAVAQKATSFLTIQDGLGDLGMRANSALAALDKTIGVIHGVPLGPGTMFNYNRKRTKKRSFNV
jgi:hypothetical protein